MSRRRPTEPPAGGAGTTPAGRAEAAGAPRELLPLRVLSGIELALGSVFFIGILVGVLYQVLGRYVPSISWIGAGELALLSMVSTTFVMIGYLTGRNGHVTLELFDRMLKGSRLFVALRVFSAVIVMVTCGWMAFDAWEKIGAEMGRVSAAIGIPMGLVFVLAFIGGLSGGIHSALKIPQAHLPERKLDVDEMEV